jgi:hypothetical protein
MSIKHIVKQGEHLPKIAVQYGFSDYQVIWNHPDNAKLKQTRKDPNVLYAGDIVVIPDKDSKEENCATDQRHTFRILGHSLPFKIRVLDYFGDPIADTKCELLIDLVSHELTTDSDGFVNLNIPVNAQRGELRIQNMNLPFRIGTLDPVEELSGWQERLNNLGYTAGLTQTPNENTLQSAVEDFQSDYKLTVDGVCGPKTQAKLKEVHGS